MLSRTRSTLFVCALVTLAAACARDEDDAAPPATEEAATPAVTQMPAELATRAEQYTTAWNGSDPAAVAQFFTEDATATVGGDTYNGRQAIRDNWLQAVPTITDLQINEMRSEMRGGDYYSEGTYTHSPPADGSSGGGGRYNILWTRGADGQWYVRSTEVMPDAAPQPQT